MIGQASATRAEVARRVEEILQRAPFQPDEPNWLEQLLLDLARKVNLEGRAGDLTLIVVALLAVIAAALTLRLIRGLLATPPSAADGASQPARSVAGESQRRAHALLEEARAARDAGDLVRALRLAFFALVVGLGRRGDLEYRDAWTNRELLERGAPSSEVRARLAPLVDELDAKGFGRQPTRREDVERLVALCERWLGEAA